MHRRCRVMLVGNGGAGKTTLAGRLTTGGPPVPSTVTYGVLQRTLAQSIICRTEAFRQLDSPCICEEQDGWLQSRACDLSLLSLYVVVHHGSLSLLLFTLRSDEWTLDHDGASCIPSDGSMEVSIMDFGGQVGVGVTLLRQLPLL